MKTPKVLSLFNGLVVVAVSVGLTACGQLDISLQNSNVSSLCFSAEALTGYSAIGLGTQDKPYVICNAQQFASIGKSPEAWASHFLIAGDLNFADFDLSTPEKSIAPIGTYDYADSSKLKAFTGSMDGRNHVLRNLKIRAEASQSAGIFGYATSASIKNLKVENVDVSGDQYVAGLVGYNSNTPITGVSISGAVYAASPFAGGLVAYNEAVGANASGKISDVKSSVAVRGNDRAGGLLGFNKAIDGGDASILDITLSGSVSESVGGGNSYGGLVGYNIATAAGLARISRVSSTATVSIQSAGSFSGGVVGTNSASGASSDASISDVHLKADITIAGNWSIVALGIGGVVGLQNCASQGKCSMTRSSYEGTFTVPDGPNNAAGVGSLFGYLSISDVGTVTEISDSFARGTIENLNAGSTRFGGLIGNTSISATIPALLVRTYSNVAIHGVAANEMAGLVSRIESNAVTVTSTYFNADATPLANSSGTLTGGTGLGGPAFAVQSSFSGFDFSSTWIMDPVALSPKLR